MNNWNHIVPTKTYYYTLAYGVWPTAKSRWPTNGNYVYSVFSVRPIPTAVVLCALRLCHTVHCIVMAISDRFRGTSKMFAKNTTRYLISDDSTWKLTKNHLIAIKRYHIWKGMGKHILVNMYRTLLVGAKLVL